MSSQSQQQQQQYQPRISMTAIIESDVPELKSFLFRFFEGAKVFAKIRHEINNSTSILVQGHPKLVPASMAYLKDLLLIRFDGAPMTCSDLFPTEDSDRLESVMIEETPVGLRRDNSSGEFREIPLQDISFGGSAATEDIKKMLQETVAAISPLGRAVGVVKTDRMHVSVQCGNTRRVVEVSGMTSLTVLYNEISKKFKSSVPVHYIYKIDGDGVVVVVTDIRDLETGVVYNVKTVNDPEPKPVITSTPFFESMDKFYSALQKEDLDDVDITEVQNIFEKEKIKASTLPRLTNEKLKEYGLAQGGLREAVLAVLGK